MCRPARACSRRNSGNGRSRRRVSAFRSRGWFCRCPPTLVWPGRFQALPDPVGDLQQDGGAWRPGLAQASAAAWAASSASSMSSAVEQAASVQLWPVTGVRLSNFWPRPGHPSAADEVVVIELLVVILPAALGCVNGQQLSPSVFWTSAARVMAADDSTYTRPASPAASAGKAVLRVWWLFVGLVRNGWQEALALCVTFQHRTPVTKWNS